MPSNDEGKTSQAGGDIKCIYYYHEYEKKPSKAYTDEHALIRLKNDFDFTDTVEDIEACRNLPGEMPAHDTVLRSVGMGQWIKDREVDSCTKLRVRYFTISFIKVFGLKHE